MPAVPRAVPVVVGFAVLAGLGGLAAYATADHGHAAAARPAPVRTGPVVGGDVVTLVAGSRPLTTSEHALATAWADGLRTTRRAQAQPDEFVATQAPALTGRALAGASRTAAVLAAQHLVVLGDERLAVEWAAPVGAQATACARVEDDGILQDAAGRWQQQLTAATYPGRSWQLATLERHGGRWVLSSSTPSTPRCGRPATEPAK